MKYFHPDVFVFLCMMLRMDVIIENDTESSV